MIRLGQMLTVVVFWTVFETALSTTTIIRPYLARSLLGWRPRKAGLLDHLDVYYQAWQASEGKM